MPLPATAVERDIGAVFLALVEHHQAAALAALGDDVFAPHLKLDRAARSLRPEPFACAAALLLARPVPAKGEVINDINGELIRLYRCV